MSDRVWAMTLDIRCSVEPCQQKDTASCADRSAHGATEGAKKILRYRGWKIGRRENACPNHAGPVPPCMLCGAPTPPEYAPREQRHITGVSHACWRCYREKASAYHAEQFAHDSSGGC